MREVQQSYRRATAVLSVASMEGSNPTWPAGAAPTGSEAVRPRVEDSSPALSWRAVLAMSLSAHGPLAPKLLPTAAILVAVVAVWGGGRAARGETDAV